MAFEIANKTISTSSKRTAVGISIPFSNQKAIFNQTYSTKEQIKSNILNYLLTNKGERVLNPSFGSNLLKQIFEQITPDLLSGLEIHLREDISNNFPLVRINTLDVIPNHDSNTITISLTYTVLNSEIENIEVNINTTQ